MIVEASCDLWYTSTVKFVVGILRVVVRGSGLCCKGFMVAMVNLWGKPYAELEILIKNRGVGVLQTPAGEVTLG